MFLQSITIFQLTILFMTFELCFKNSYNIYTSSSIIISLPISGLGGSPISCLGHTLSQVRWVPYLTSCLGGTLSLVRGYPISCPGVPHFMSGGTLFYLMFGGTLSQVREGPPFHMWGDTPYHVRQIPYLTSGLEGTLSHIWGGTVSHLRCGGYLFPHPSNYILL